MKIDKKNLLLGGIFAGLGALMLVLGIFAFEGSYFFLPLMGHLGEIFAAIMYKVWRKFCIS